MKHLYTLRKSMTGSHGEALNGKIFYTKKQINGSVAFLDAQNDNKALWVTTQITNIGYTPTGVVFTTKHTVYDLIDVAFLIPTAIKISPDENLEWEENTEPELLSEEKGPFKHIHYGDGYSISYLTFNRQMQEFEIRTWLAAKGRVYKKQSEVPWYEDYAELHPMNATKTKWEVKRVMRYTD